MANRYWVGGTDTWDGTAGSKWATSSGGGGGSAVPTAADDVFFDASSGAVTITTSGTTTDNCRSINFTGFTGTFSHASNTTVRVGDGTTGHFTMVAGMTYTRGSSISSRFTFISTTTGNNITTGGQTLSGVTFNGSGGAWTLQDNLTTTWEVTGSNGTLDTNDFVVSMLTFQGAPTFTIDLASATHLITGTVWNANGSNLITGTYTLKFTDTSSSILEFFGENLTYNNVWFDRGGSVGDIYFFGANTFNDFRDTGTVAHILYFPTGEDTTVSSFTVSGSSGNLISIDTHLSESPVTLTHSLIKTGGGTISSDYLNIQHSVATPASTWYAGNNSTNNQGVADAGSGWIFTSPPLAPFSITFDGSTDDATSNMKRGVLIF